MLADFSIHVSVTGCSSILQFRPLRDFSIQVIFQCDRCADGARRCSGIATRGRHFDEVASALATCGRRGNCKIKFLFCAAIAATPNAAASASCNDVVDVASAANCRGVRELQWQFCKLGGQFPQPRPFADVCEWCKLGKSANGNDVVAARGHHAATIKFNTSISPAQAIRRRLRMV